MPAPAHSRGARTYWCQNQGAPRSDARPTAPRQAHNSVRAALAISWRPTPPAPTGQPKKLFYSFSSSVASSDAGQACRSSNPDSDKTRCVACRCSQTPPLAAQSPRGCVGGSPPLAVFHASSHFTTHASRRKGVLPRRLRCRLISAHCGEAVPLLPVGQFEPDAEALPTAAGVAYDTPPLKGCCTAPDGR